MQTVEKKDFMDDKLPPETIRAINGVAEDLVRLGFATRTVASDLDGSLHIQFTREGKMLQEQISRVMTAITSGDSLDIFKLQAFMVIMGSKQFDEL